MHSTDQNTWDLIYKTVCRIYIKRLCPENTESLYKNIMISYTVLMLVLCWCPFTNPNQLEIWHLRCTLFSQPSSSPALLDAVQKRQTPWT